MTKRFVCGVCLILLVTPGMVLHAQDEISPEKKPDESKLVDSTPSMTTVTEGSEIDSVPKIEILPDSLAIAPSLRPSVSPPLESTHVTPQYGFKGTGRDIVIGAAVLTGWFVVAFLAANQGSE